MKIGVIDVGGGYRGIYAAGVFDYCMDNNIQFDLGIGVSAGSANIISYKAGQARRNYKFYTEYGLRKEYASPRNFLIKKTFIDLDYAYTTLSSSNGEYPIDFDAFLKSPMSFYVVATEAKTGNVKYFNQNDIKKDDYSPLKASCAIPFVCHPYSVDGVEYFDGALSDSVPIEKAFELGCDKVVLILTKPEGEIRKSKRDDKIARLIKRSYPLSSVRLQERAETYNKGIRLAQKYAKEGKVLIISPDDTCGVSTLTRDKELLDRLYKKGYKDGEKIKALFL